MCWLITVAINLTETEKKPYAFVMILRWSFFKKMAVSMLGLMSLHWRMKMPWWLIWWRLKPQKTLRFLDLLTQKLSGDTASCGCWERSPGGPRAEARLRKWESQGTNWGDSPIDRNPIVMPEPQEWRSCKAWMAAKLICGSLAMRHYRTKLHRILDRSLRKSLQT